MVFSLVGTALRNAAGPMMVASSPVMQLDADQLRKGFKPRSLFFALPTNSLPWVIVGHGLFRFWVRQGWV